MVDIAGSVFAGLERGTAYRKMEEQEAAAMEQNRREQERRQRLSGLLGAYAQGQDVLPQIAQMGPEGIEAAKGLSGMMPKPEDMLKKFEFSYQAARALPDDRRSDAYQAMIAAGVQSGVLTEDQGDQLSFATAQDPASFEGFANRVFGLEEKPQAAPASGVKAVVYPDGRQAAFDITDPTERGLYKEAVSQGAKPAPTRQEVGEAGAFDLTKKEAASLKEAEVFTAQAIATADDILQRIQEDPEAFSTAASLAGIASGLAAEVDAVSSAFGVDLPDSVKDSAQYASTFEDLGIKNKQLQGLALDLAISYAAASGMGTGRALSDKDVRRALERVGAGGLATPKARIAAIGDVRKILERNFRIKYERTANKPYEGDFGKGPEIIEVFEGAPEIGSEVGGYRYKGGDPASPDSWEKI